MKFLVSLLFFSSFWLSSFAQFGFATHSNKPNDPITSANVYVKLNNNSLKTYHLVIPNVLETESVMLGSNSFCMAQGQEIYFAHEGQNYLLLTASALKKQKYHLNKLVKARKRELGLK
jgi:hypothetical protein